MNLVYLYTSFEGRLNRKRFWLGILLLAAISIVIASQVKLVNFVLQLVLLYPSAALMVKRLHDRNRPGYFAVFWLAPGLLYNLADVAGFSSSGPAKMNVLEIVLLFVTIAVGIAFFIELGCRRGTVGANRYGPDPLWAGFARAPAR